MCAKETKYKLFSNSDTSFEQCCLEESPHYEKYI